MDVVDGRYLEVLIRRDDEACEVAVGVVLRVASPLGIAVHTVDVDSAPGLPGELAGRVPVVRGPNGAVIDEGTISPERVRPPLCA